MVSTSFLFSTHTGCRAAEALSFPLKSHINGMWTRRVPVAGSHDRWIRRVYCASSSMSWTTNEDNLGLILYRNMYLPILWAMAELKLQFGTCVWQFIWSKAHNIPESYFSRRLKVNHFMYVVLCLYLLRCLDKAIGNSIGVLNGHPDGAQKSAYFDTIYECCS